MPSQFLLRSIEAINLMQEGFTEYWFIHGWEKSLHTILSAASAGTEDEKRARELAQI